MVINVQQSSNKPAGTFGFTPLGHKQLSPEFVWPNSELYVCWVVIFRGGFKKASAETSWLNWEWGI